MREINEDVSCDRSHLSLLMVDGFVMLSEGSAKVTLILHHQISKQIKKKTYRFFFNEKLLSFYCFNMTIRIYLFPRNSLTFRRHINPHASARGRHHGTKSRDHLLLYILNWYRLWQPPIIFEPSNSATTVLATMVNAGSMTRDDYFISFFFCWIVYISAWYFGLMERSA